ncbi:hypothetical protein [Corynebacterium senegalense]|uniref:hypothetical protein n=1 Tax=Corynebacterium senegalense TaxID=2080750 RepID=UPI000E2043CA|nr:hypothetical protein [Corynebacterium senegalense]
MDYWVPSVISGVFSLVVVLVGALAVDRREKRSQALEHSRAANAAQREAVATYIKAVRTAAWKANEERIEVLKKCTDDHQLDTWSPLERAFNTYRDAYIHLDLELTNPEVRKAAAALDHELSKRYEHLAEVLTWNSWESWSEINKAQTMPPHCEALISELAATAREHLH